MKDNILITSHDIITPVDLSGLVINVHAALPKNYKAPSQGLPLSIKPIKKGYVVTRISTTSPETYNTGLIFDNANNNTPIRIAHSQINAFYSRSVIGKKLAEQVHNKLVTAIRRKKATIEYFFGQYFLTIPGDEFVKSYELR